MCTVRYEDSTNEVIIALALGRAEASGLLECKSLTTQASLPVGRDESPSLSSVPSHERKAFLINTSGCLD